MDVRFSATAPVNPQIRAGQVSKFGPICLVITLARKRVKAKNVTNYKVARV